MRFVFILATGLSSLVLTGCFNTNGSKGSDNPTAPKRKPDECKVTRSCDDALRNLNLLHVAQIRSNLQAQLELGVNQQVTPTQRKVFVSLLLGFEVRRVLGPKAALTDESYLALYDLLVTADGQLSSRTDQEVVHSL